MKREKQTISGIMLSSPQIKTVQPSPVQRFFFYWLLLLLGLTGAYACFLTAIETPVYMPALIFCGLVFSAGFTALFIKKSRRTRFLAPGIAVWVIALFFLFDEVATGAVVIINHIIAAYGESYGVHFLSLPFRPLTAAEEQLSCTLFSIFLLFWVALSLAWLLVSEKNWFLCFFVTLPFIAIPLVYTIIPHAAATAALVLYWAFLFLLSPAFRRPKEKINGVKRKRRFKSGHEAAARMISLLILPILALYIVVLGTLFPSFDYQRPQTLDDLRSGLIRGEGFADILRNWGLAGSQDHVDLSNAGDLHFTGKTVLRVKTSNQEVDYLKGFVGSVYTGQSWERLSQKESERLNFLLDGEAVQNLPNRFQMLLPFEGDESELYNISVQNLNGNPHSVYTPYGLVSSPGEMGDVQLVEDGFLQSSDSLFGTEQYSMTARRISGQDRSLTYYERMLGFLENRVGMYQLYSMGDEVILSRQSGVENPMRRYDKWKLPEALQLSMTGAEFSFTQRMQAYVDFIYENYTALPLALSTRLRQYLNDHGLDLSDYYSYDDFANAVIAQIQSENTYTLSPGTTPQGQDFVEHFLFESHEGYCVHFASAAAALLRAAGVPARYAEGYTVSPEDPQSSDGWINVPDSRAHAWVEIYASGVGWIPVEATPGGSDNEIYPVPQPEESSTAPSSLPSSSSSETPETSASSSEPSGTPDTDSLTGEVNPEKAAYVSFIIPLMAVLLLLLLTGGLLFNRWLHMKVWQKKFSQPNRQQAAIAVYDYLQKLLFALQEARCKVDELPQELTELALAARFSRHTFKEEDVQKLLSYAQILRRQTGKKLSWWQRFLLKYVKGLL